MPYIEKAQSKRPGVSGCLFCAKGRLRPGPGNLVLARTPRVIVMLNRYPYNVGHLMVAPVRHVKSFARLASEESLEIAEWLGRLEQALGRSYRPHGLNVGVNVGRVAGAGVLGHIHWHVVPRWNGDTNFMPATAGIKVLPEALDRTYGRLLSALERPGADRRSGPRKRARRGER